jgi:eukaryotic-like serine/threonine-protein kinase
MPQDQPGTVLGGKYELMRVVGQGGMAVVWRAVTRGAAGFQRPVAVKRLDASVKGFSECTDMFIEEARVGALLHHPNIVQIHDFGVDHYDDYYLVSEWIEGLHLGDFVASFREHHQGTPWSVIAAVAVEVLRALDAAHSRVDSTGRPAPILHRDVSPPNILLDVAGVVKLADFGMARAMDRGRVTRPDIIKGKLSYLAPELISGEEPSVASDLFALGIVMWEALTSERLFDAETDIGVIRLLRDARVPLLSMKRPELPMGLCTVVHRALDRAPARRYASALDMLRALTDVLRVLPASTDGASLARAVAAARQRLDPQGQQVVRPAGRRGSVR